VTDWLQPLQGDWPSAVCRVLNSELAVVRVLIADMRGSGPREPGACMLVSEGRIEGTIGGGHLEWEAIETAREMLTARASGRRENVPCTHVPSESVRTQRLVLGTELGQCCGGVVQLWYERFTASDLPFLQAAAEKAKSPEMSYACTQLKDGGVTRQFFAAPALAEVRFAQNEDASTLFERLDHVPPELWLFGAGHVGQALVHVLNHVPLRIVWVDSRDNLFPEKLPDGVRVLHVLDPLSVLPQAPAGALFLVMTHDHALDYALCRSILESGQFAWLGLIGSASKGARFRSRLRRDGLMPDMINRLICPIGVEGVESKVPAAIAIAVAAQLLQVLSHPHRSGEVETSCDGRDCATCSATYERLR
jgi:xanthine dehydrogenase accessory factor